MKKKNRNYTIDELVHSSSFRRMVKGTASSDEIEKWNSWIEESDQNRDKVKSAISVITGFEFTDPASPDMEKAWDRLFGATIGKQDIPHLRTADKDSSLRWIYRVAAAILLISMVGVGGYLYSVNDQAFTQLEQISRKKTVTTQQGEQKSLKFSNGSKIVLNSNSRLTYTQGTLHEETIQIVLEGEAYFDAAGSGSNNQPVFAITTPDGIIEDIGTKFLVTVEDDRSRVVLQEGMVKIEAQEGKIFTREAYLNKGEMIEFNATRILEKDTVNPTFYTSWATGFMEFDQTRISEFAEYIEKRFGVDVQIVNSGLADVTIDGAVYFNSLEGLVRSVSKVIKVSVYQSEDKDTVYIGNYRQDHE